MFDSLLEGKACLQEIAISQSADMDSPIKRILLDNVFWESVVSSLKPIAVAIALIEEDNAILSDVQTLLADVREEIHTALPTSLLLQAEETAVLKYIKKHLDFCLKPIPTAAYMLDPKNAGASCLVQRSTRPMVSSLPCLATLAWMRARFLAVWRSTLPSKGFMSTYDKVKGLCFCLHMIW
jgi:hypothetical protein